MLKFSTTKRALVVIAAALALTTAIAVSAKAEVRNYANNGYWTNYAGMTNGTSKPICGIFTENREHNMSIHIKLIEGKIWIAAFKNSWRFSEATPVKVEISFDGTVWGDAVATGSMLDKISVVAFAIRNDSVASFLEDASHANKMMLTFPEGSETPWHANMEGSRAAIASLKYCGTRIGADRAPTQPYGSVPTQPYGSGPTQPYGSTPTPTPDNLPKPTGERGA